MPAVSQIVRKGFCVSFDLNECKISDAKKNVIATGSLKDDIFTFDISNPELAYAVKTDVANTLLGHRQSGHASVNKLNILHDTKKPVKCYECGGPHFRNKCPELEETITHESNDYIMDFAFIELKSEL